jgi:hypothetical protein
VRIISLGDKELGIAIPQMIFHARADGIIDLNGVTRLTEKQVWTVIESIGIPYTDWCLRKEYSQMKPFLHLYIELRNPDVIDVAELTRLINEKLRGEDTGYEWMLKMIESDPLEVSIVKPGSFGRYMEQRQKEGADLAHIKPPHLNASDTVIERLMKLS